MESLISSAVGKSLAKMVANGLLTLENLDRPSPGYLETERSRNASLNPCDYTDPNQKTPVYNEAGSSYDTYPRPTVKYPTRPKFKNLAREWIAANKKEWSLMNNKVFNGIEACPSDHDFAA